MLLVFVAAELLAVAADQREWLDVDGRDAEPGLLGGGERLTERLALTGEQDDFPFGRFALPHVGRLDEAEFRVIQSIG